MFVLFCCLWCALAAVALGQLVTEKNLTVALGALYSSTNGQNWRILIGEAPWSFPVPQGGINPCAMKWVGISCSAAGDSIVSLSLSNRRLFGKLPTAIGMLLQLTNLDLSMNSISGSIPSQLYSLTSLVKLDLSSNRLTQTISPAIGRITALQTLSLFLNRISGTLPFQLWSLTQLKWISVYDNNLGGSLPWEIGGMSALTMLSLRNNSFWGSLPRSINGVSQLKILSLRDNFFTSSLPTSLFSLTNLVTLYLYSNSFSGSLSPAIGGLTGLTRFRIDKNKLSGRLPTELGLLTNLVVLGVSNNKLTGFPATITSRSIQYLFLENNLFSGTFPSQLISLTNLVHLDVSYNSYFGTLPSTLGSLRQLVYLSCNNNSFSGPFPSSLWQMTTLVALYLDFNRLSGTISPSIAALRSLKFLSIFNNNFQGSVPSELWTLTNLVTLDLAFNRLLSGTIHQTIQSFQNLQHLEFRNCSFSGTLPPQVCTLPLQLLDIANNQYSGNVPSCIANMQTLKILVLSGNRLTSTSGLDFLLAPNITTADVSSNFFGGTLPAKLFQSTVLTTLAASSNCLGGTLPSTLCKATSLQNLVLDGLGSSCQVEKYARDNIFKFHAKKNTKTMSGSMPECIYSSFPNIALLHLSGNGLAGLGFPANLPNLPSQLTDLSISFNRLGGPIPASVQRMAGQLKRFDVATNKLNGVVDSLRTSPNGTYRFQVNRFSGNLSPDAIKAANIAVLKGSLIDCNDRSQLPLTDPFINQFRCGSNTFNRFMIAFSVMAGLTGLAILAGYRLLTRQTTAVSLHPYVEHFLSTELQNLRSLGALAAFVLIFCLLPFFAALTQYSRTHEYLYAWTVSAGYKSGTNSSIFSIFVMTTFTVVFFWRTLRQAKILDGVTETAREDDGDNLQIRLLLLFRLMVIFVVNGFCVLAPNVGYVIVVASKDVSSQILASLALTLYKQTWNSFALPHLLESKFFYFGIASDDIGNQKRKWRKGILLTQFEVFLIAFNTVVASAASLLVADNNCFFTAFYAPRPINTYYLTRKFFFLRDYSFSTVGNVTTMLTATTLASTNVSNNLSYSPPFMYSYQCSSTLLQYYAPVYFLIALYSTFGEPIVHAAIRWAVTQWPQYSILLSFLPRYMWILKEREELNRWGLQISAAKLIGKRRKHVVLNLRSVYRLYVRDFLILLTFGAVVPLLGLIVVLAISSRTFFMEHYILHFVQRQSDLEKESLIESCAAIALKPSPIFTSRWLFVAYSSLSVSFFLLDMAGDEVGLTAAVWAPVLMWIVPPGLCCFVEYCVRNECGKSTDLLRAAPANHLVENPLRRGSLSSQSIRSLNSTSNLSENNQRPTGRASRYSRRL